VASAKRDRGVEALRGAQHRGMAWDMPVAAIALFGWLVLGPPVLPPEIGDAPPVADPEPPPESAEPPAEEVAPSEEVTPAEEVAPTEDVAPAEDIAPPVEPPVEPPIEDEPIPISPEPEPEAIPIEPAGGAPVQRPGGGAVQKPSGGTTPAPAVVPPPTEETPASDTPAQTEPAAEEEPETYRKLGGFRLFRVGIAAKIGYTHGTSDKNGVFDRDKSIADSIDNMMVTTSGAGALGKTQFGGPQFGFILDAEIVGINAWLDFHKFFRPGGMWSLLLGYDHEFGFNKRLRLDVGVAGGLNQVFFGKVLSGLYYDQENPEAVNIGTLGVEGRAMADLHIKIVGPLFTGPYAMIGYHYLWSANTSEVTREKGLHYSVGWTLRLDFAAPKLIGGKAKKKTK
jgi:hypothetical protein